MWNDLRFSGRLLLRSPAFTVASVLTLALAMGINIAVFSIAEAVFSPLPYASPERLVAIWGTNLAEGKEHERVTPPDFLDYRSLSEVFDDAAAWWRYDVNLADHLPDPLRVSTAECTGNFFRVLGISPMLGSGFGGKELHSPALHAVISHRLWRDRYGSDPEIVGKVIGLGGNDYTIVGVMGSGFAFPSADIDIWQYQSWPFSARSRFARFMEAVGRLRDAVTLEAAQAELTALSERLEEEHGASNKNWRAVITGLHAEIIGEVGDALRVLMVASGLLLLLACINIASLLLVRAQARDSEAALRTAVGAPPWSLVRLAVSEAIALAGSATIAGFALAAAGLRLTESSVRIPRIQEVSIDHRAVAFAVGVMVVTVIALGLLPSFRWVRSDVRQLLHATVLTRQPIRYRKVLIVGQTALALALVTGAWLLVRSMGRLNAQDTGFVEDDVATVTVELPLTLYPEWPRVRQTFTEFFNRLREHPAVEATGGAGFLPYSPAWVVPYFLPEQTGEVQRAQYVTITEGYLETLRATLLAGRWFTDRDGEDSPNVIVINRRLAQQSWGGAAEALGHVLRVGTLGFGPLGQAFTEDRMFEVIGVAADIKNKELSGETDPAIYFSSRQFAYRTLHVVMRGEGTPTQLAAVAEGVLEKIDPSLPVSSVRKLEDLSQAQTERQRLLTMLITVFAVAACVLAAIGIYGLLTYMVAQRRQELALRLSLGATSSNLRNSIISEGLRLALAGAVIGGLLSIAVGRLFESVLYQIPSYDPLSFTLAVVAIGILGLAASIGPALSTRHVLPREINSVLAR